ncbi:glucose-1-phosphatase-like [Cydia pomonella]|uniref:glucose-1-phosphatase-like n=1 Tax=Cydia pomonella TaxID=82600 RepID=UPI002ADE3D64|nr:glucose-1-phosphatase-like [Cydia pomonella]
MFLQLIITTTLCLSGQGYELKQVFIISRHNIRTPFFHNMAFLSPKKWPTWNLEPGKLTPKGRLLEYHMGKYFAGWIIKEKLFDNNCPKDQVFVHANNKSRTKETAISFTKGAFRDCVSTYFKNNTSGNGSDPVFRSSLRNSSEEFRKAAIYEMKKKFDNLKLESAFLELNRIVDFENSSYCKTEKVCDLSEARSEFFVQVNKSPDVLGGLKIGWRIVDNFLMEYYDGMAPENVAWGEIQTVNQWESLMAILRGYLELRFATKNLDRDIASNLLEYVTDIFLNGQKKFYLIVGHDGNISLLMSSLRFKDYVLHDQLEKAPIGGKLVFQKWYDAKKDQDLLRVNYVYHSTKQIRDGVEVSLQNPPQWQLLEMENCAVDGNGFCPWNDFIYILKTV